MGDLKVGVVGLGWVAGAHIETFKAVTGAEVTTVRTLRACAARTIPRMESR